MNCKPTSKKINSTQRTELKHQKFNFDNLAEKGRIKFFFHCPDSKYPIRDIIYQEKTEPHIEKNAENYCSECYQHNVIVPFLCSDEKYLFLFTTCRSGHWKKYKDHSFIVGYIVKEKALWRSDHWAIQGKTYMYSFLDAYPLPSKNPRHQKRLKTEKETEKILNHFESKTNILTNCIREMNRLKQGKARTISSSSC